MDGMRSTDGAAELDGTVSAPSRVSRLPRAKPAWSDGGKRIMDLILAAALMAPLIPLLGAIALLLRITNGPGVLVRHPRIGRDGSVFRCLKFRTMVLDGDQVLAAHLEHNEAARREWRQYRKLAEDPRVTPVGRLLRRSSLDELPQILNVLRGEMSLVGPRPVVQAELDEHYRGEAAHLYCSVRPGVTGLWQVSGRSGLGYPERVGLDVQYVRTASLALDLQILCRTPLAVLRARGAC
jgi:lipopolysaccharide/colanic/teichoic acid biosynthesis glycosyltransferase